MQISFKRKLALVAASLAVLAAVPFSPANAQIVLSNLIVELMPGKESRQDIEVLNSGADRAYVAV